MKQPAKATFKLQSLQGRDKWFKAVFYGTNGAGKTELAGTAADVPDMQDVFIISAEKGLMTLDETDRIEHKEHIFNVDVDSISEVETIRKWLIAHCVAREADDEDALRELEVVIGFRVAAEDHPAKRFRCVVIDTLTEVQAFAMTQTLGISNNLAFDAEIPDSEWSHYNKILNRMQMLMRAFRDLHMHTIFLVQEDFKQDQTKKMLYSPALMGKMGQRIQGFADVCGRIEMVPGEKSGVWVRRLWIQPVDKNAAKSRFGKFKNTHIDDASLPRILAALTTGKELLVDS